MIMSAEQGYRLEGMQLATSMMPSIRYGILILATAWSEGSIGAFSSFLAAFFSFLATFLSDLFPSESG